MVPIDRFAYPLFYMDQAESIYIRGGKFGKHTRLFDCGRTYSYCYLDVYK